jgi:serine/threonine-protein kinase
MSMTAGTKLGRYEIRAQLGAGGMGEVYLAEDTQLGRRVAIKLLPTETISNEHARKRLVREARAAAKLDHPTICSVYEVGEEGGHSFIVMQYLEGETLDTRMTRKPLEMKESLTIASQVADALSEAHAHGIIHRDIKPSNIILTPRGQAKVMDFGLARMTTGATDSEAETQSLLTTPGAVIGTVPYMSPEQVRGESLDARSDIFSFGVTLYEMLSGRQPFASESAAATASAILTHEPPPLARFAPDVPEELQRIVRKCLEKDREQRYQSARDLAIDLENIRRQDESARVQLLSEDRLPAKSGAPGVAASAKRPMTFASWRVLVPVAAMVVLVGAGLVYMLLFRRAPGASVLQIKSLAVLPLENLSGDPAQEYFADGMTEALTSDLAQIRALKVISRTSVMQYKGARKPTPQIARELGVDGVVAGSVAREGNEVRVTVHLIHGATDQDLWTNNYNRQLRSILALQSEVAQAIAAEIKVALTPEEKNRLTSTRVVNPEAHEAYLKGRYYLNKALTEEGIRKALEYFQQALDKDPTYAPGYAGLADCYSALPDFYLAPSETMPKAKQAAVKALELDETLAEAHNSLAFVSFIYDWDFVAAEREFKRAIELNPSEAPDHESYAIYLAAMGRFPEAMSEAKRAQELDPLSVATNAGPAYQLQWARQYDESIRQLHKVIDMEPNFWPAHMHLGLAYEGSGKFREAATELEKARQLSDSPLVLAMLGGVYAVSGRRAEAMKVLEELKKQAKQRFVCPYETGTVYVGLGETEEAFKWLEKGYQERSQCMVWTKTDPRLDPIRSDPRLADLMRRLGF